MVTDIQDEVPWSDNLTDYDNEHFTIYMRLLDASADDASEEEMAEAILGIDPANEPERAQKALRSHLDRANWMVTTGYKELFAS
ncbi:DNA -binding domain-containing protein [Pelagibacterium sp.]|uniref:DNA -binding domain-containing protein n=1 Tax=Pelagibacterium sp. TaxID=1967288 RepID=UPI003BAC47BF